MKKSLKLIDFAGAGLTIPNLISLRDFYRDRVREGDSDISIEDFHEKIRILDDTLANMVDKNNCYEKEIKNG